MTLELQIYTSLLADVKERIRGGQFRAAQSVNAELIQMYWDIGHMLHERQEQQGWGAGIIPKLARDIVNELPEVKGFSDRTVFNGPDFFGGICCDLVFCCVIVSFLIRSQHRWI
ncbi:DUF1016 N-terminal domain-containing protein [Photorhabdus temperata]|uniref:DUF1016 N-terminal domain-containing protein n=1 Tax=Photorhabdus temperata TaxID=574560 RepID=UPI00038A25A3|nr:DUF1016 N-terminal domain-containing protein [Photorhabdus temperata]EQB97978.1 hypothetical protein B738_27727 [Photorhabdus temperata subsp. temperata M1021]